MSNREQRRNLSKAERERIQEQEKRARVKREKKLLRAEQRKIWFSKYKKIIIIVACCIMVTVGVGVGLGIALSSSNDNTNSYKLVMLSSDTCAPCKELEPTIKQLKSEYKGDINIVIYDINNSATGRSLADKHNVSATPTMLFFKNDKVVEKMEGAQPRSNIENMFRSLGWIN